MCSTDRYQQDVDRPDLRYTNEASGQWRYFECLPIQLAQCGSDHRRTSRPRVAASRGFVTVSGDGRRFTRNFGPWCPSARVAFNRCSDMARRCQAGARTGCNGPGRLGSGRWTDGVSSDAALPVEVTVTL